MAPTEEKDEEFPYFGKCVKADEKDEWGNGHEDYVDSSKRFTYGYNFDPKMKEITVLLIGASQCGKSTLINFFANFFKGVSSPKEKEKLVKVTKDQDNESAFTAYTFCCTEDLAFTLIDAPSINDSHGYVIKERKKAFSTFLSAVKEKGIKINAVGFVVQNHFVRLAPAEDINMRFLTSLLDKEHMKNIIPFITYADAQTPPVLDALKAYEINTDTYFSFNNVNLNESSTTVTKLNEVYWDEGLEKVNSCLELLMKLEPIEQLKEVVEDEVNASQPETEKEIEHDKPEESKNEVQSTDSVKSEEKKNETPTEISDKPEEKKIEVPSRKSGEVLSTNTGKTENQNKPYTNVVEELEKTNKQEVKNPDQHSKNSTKQTKSHDKINEQGEKTKGRKKSKCNVM